MEPVFDPKLPNDTNAPAILAIIGVLTTLTLIIMSLRIWVRAVMLRTWGADDWCLIISTLCGIGMLIVFIGETMNGMGRYDQYITPDMRSEMNHWNYPGNIIVVLGISCVKLSVGFVLLRFVEKPLFKRLIWGSIIFLILFTITCEATLIFSCVPPAANWDTTLAADAKCFSLETFTAIGLFNTSVNIITDVFFATLPIPVIWNLNLNKKTKISLIVVLSLGYFGCAAAIVKAVYQVNIFFTPNASRWNYYSLWNIIELFIGILAAALPALRPLVTHFLGTTKGSTGGIMGRSARPRHAQYGYGRGTGPSRHISGVFSDSMQLKSMNGRDETDTPYAGPFVKIDERSESQKSILEPESPQASSPPSLAHGILKTTNFSISEHRV